MNRPAHFIDDLGFDAPASFPTRIDGIPCLIQVTHYSAPVSGRYSGAPESCYPDEPAELEYDVLDRAGRPAGWLAAKITPADADRILSEYLRT